MSPTPPSTMQCPGPSAAAAWAGEPAPGLAKIHPSPAAGAEGAHVHGAQVAAALAAGLAFGDVRARPKHNERGESVLLLRGNLW